MDDSSGNIDQQLLKAYQETTYEVMAPPISIQIGVQNPVLDAFLQENDAQSWAFITAWNPQSQLLSHKENNRRHQELTKMVKNAGYPYFIGKGIGKKEDWEPELSLFIIHISKAKATETGSYFNQKAIVFGEKGGLPTLLFL